jgi:hypothetical protein
MLRLNFFQTWLPEGNLSLMTRKPDVGSNLLGWERYRYETSAGAMAPERPRERQKDDGAVVVRSIPSNYDRSKYAVEHRLVRELDPGIVKPLTSLGLQDSLQQKGLEIEINPIGFLAKEGTAVSSIPLPPEISLHRAMRFRPDHLVVQGRRLYGFFVSPHTKLAFANGLDADEALNAALIGDRVSVVREGVTISGDLESTDYRAGSAVISRVSERLDVRLKDVVPRATPGAIARYLRILGKPDEARSVRLAPQVANFRLSANGQRNRRWLMQQYQYVCSWLVSKSESGRLRFKWPYSETEIYVNAEAIKLE